MLESFGARLRRRREEQDITLVTVAEQTKLKSSLLDALERDDLRHWPAGFFRRAFIRAYAEAIGLNPDVVIREFLEAHPEPVEAVEPTAPSGPAPTRFSDLVDSALGSLSRLGRKPMAASPVVPPSAPVPATKPPLPDPDFQAVAQICTQFARVRSHEEVQPVLREAARILDAIGLIVWIWDPLVEELKPALAHGYTQKVLSQMPAVKRDASNATAAAFRSAQPCAINGNDRARGALVVPLLTSSGCAGVLAIELPPSGEQSSSVRAIATIFAAQLAQFIGARSAEEAPTTVEPPRALHQFATALAEG